MVSISAQQTQNKVMTLQWGADPSQTQPDAWKTPEYGLAGALSGLKNYSKHLANTHLKIHYN